MKLLTTTMIGTLMLATSALAANQVPVITGGIGKASQEAIKQAEKEYSVKLVFTGDQGMYLGDVAVKIRDKDGMEVVNGMTEGPFLLADLKPGKYTMEAETHGYNKKLNLNVGESLKTYQVSFPVEDDPEVSAARSEFNATEPAAGTPKPFQQPQTSYSQPPASGTASQEGDLNMQLQQLKQRQQQPATGAQPTPMTTY